jgi:hypothetical protein
MKRILELLPTSDEGRSLLLGLGLVAGGFMLAELLDSILYAPLGLIVPGLLFVFMPFMPSREGD